MITFGCDPELFLSYKKDGKDFVLSPALAEFLIPDFKEIKLKDDSRHPEEIFKHPLYFIMQHFYSWMMDGCAIELTLLKPYSSGKEMYFAIQESIRNLEQFAENFSYENQKLSVFKKPVINIEPELYTNLLDNEKIYQGFIFGCDPDEDGIIRNYKCNTIDVFEHKFRYGGGHWHIGNTDTEIINLIHKNPEYFVKLMAIFVGNLSIAFSNYPEEEKLRANTYGKPGRYRLPKWGFEYRSPSNSWIENLDTILLMEKGSKNAINFLQNSTQGNEIINKYLDKTVYSIINCDQESAMEIINEVM